MEHINIGELIKESDYMKHANIEKRSMKIEDLHPHPGNPRISLTPEMPAYRKLKKAILNFNYIDPVIWNEATQRVIGGHQRLTILKDLGFDTVDVSVVNEPDEKKELAMVIALNKIEGEWDVGKLAEAFSTMEPTMEELTGFEKIEIDNILTILPEFDPEKEYRGMPEFVQEKEHHRSIIIHFQTEDDVESFGNLIGQNITDETKFLWYPYREKENKKPIRYASEASNE